MHTKLTLGERLKDLRIERGCTLEELAAQTGLSKGPLVSTKPTSREMSVYLPLLRWPTSMA